MMVELWLGWLGSKTSCIDGCRTRYQTWLSELIDKSETVIIVANTCLNYEGPRACEK
jgi:hypothetical protein